MSTEDAELWRVALDGIAEVTQGRTNDLLLLLKYLRSDGNRMLVKVNGPRQERDWLNDRLKGNLERELWRLTQRVYAVEFVLDIPTMRILPSAGDRFGMWIEWRPYEDMPVVAGCWRMGQYGELSSGYTPEELSQAMRMIGRALPAGVARKEMKPHLRRLEIEHSPRAGAD